MLQLERGYEQVSTRNINGNDYYLVVNEKMSPIKEEIGVQYCILKYNKQNIKTIILIKDFCYDKENYTKNTRRNKRKSMKKVFFRYLDSLKDI